MFEIGDEGNILPEKEEVTGGGRKSNKRSFVTFALRHALPVVSKHLELRGRSIDYAQMLKFSRKTLRKETT